MLSLLFEFSQLKWILSYIQQFLLMYRDFPKEHNRACIVVASRFQAFELAAVGAISPGDGAPNVA